MLRLALFTISTLFLGSNLVSAQGLSGSVGNNTPPVVGGVGGIRAPERPPLLSGNPDATAKVHRTPMGQPCVTVGGYAKAQSINQNIYDHFIFATNNCGLRIKMKVCYYKTEHCMQMDMPPYDHKEAVLGIFPALKEFRYEYREQF